MDIEAFDRIARKTSAAPGRRQLLAGLLGGALSATFLLSDPAAGKKRRKKRRKKSSRSTTPTPLTPSTPSRPTAPPQTTTQCAMAEAYELLGLVNTWRTQNGAAPLVLEGVLQAAAATKSAAMARTGVFSHTVEGIDERQNLLTHGYPVEQTAYGENIAAGSLTAAKRSRAGRTVLSTMPTCSTQPTRAWGWR